MAAETATNGEMSKEDGGLTPAQKLQEKHDADASHNPTIEDVLDEEDLAHPPPSMQSASAAGPPAPQAAPSIEATSEKAVGKQKAKEEPEAAATRGKSHTGPDTKSEELFPALGAGPKPKTPAAAPMAWGAQKPGSVSKVGSTNGINGRWPLSSSPSSSRASTPAPGILTPAPTNASMRPQSRGGPQSLSLPGKHSEKIEFSPFELLPKNQLKKPIRDILQNINKRSKATVTMRPGPNNGLVFEGVGPFEATRQALRDVAKEIGSKQSTTIDVPMSVRPHIIGKQGSTVKGISDRTGARIQVSKADEPPFPTGEDDDIMATVTIEGDPVSAYLARQEVEGIVNERTSTVNFRLRDIPAEFYPYLAGPRNASIDALEDGRQVKIHVPHYQSWSHQPPPQAPAPGNLPLFIAHPESHIRISGDRLAAQEVRSELQRQVEELRRRITLEHIAIDRGRHQFILGDGPEALHQLMEETGCAVILPPESDDTEMLVVTGPSDKINIGVEKVLDLASSMQMSSIDVARQHANAPRAHARALVQFLQKREAMRQLEKQYDARIVANDGAIEVFSRDGKSTMRARSDILNLVNAYPPSRLRQVDVDPFFHQHIQEQAAQQVRDQYGVHLLLPEETLDEQNVVLIYEGLPHVAASQQLARQKPTAAEVANFERGLQQAQEHILELLQGQQDLDSRSFEVPTKFHGKVRKYVEREQHKTPSNIPAQLYFGPNDNSRSRGLNGGLSASEAVMHTPASVNEARLRGPRNILDDLMEKIAAFVEAEKQDELERGHITTFDFPQKYANFLIGKRGENINKYREEFDVDIQVSDGKVEIKGPKGKADVAKSRIIALGKKLEDETTHTLKIKPQYHREIIGAKGNQVNRLQERYNVRVQFPRTSNAEDRSNADVSSDVAARNHRSNQAPDEVVIRGPRKGADEARDEILTLLQWTIDNSHTATISVAQGQLPSLIGQGGREMEKIRLETGAHVDVPGARESADTAGRVQVHVKGSKKQVDDAKKLLEQRARIFDESITRIIEVDRKYHKALIGSGGSNIRNIVVDSGGSDDRRELARMVRFPKQESDETTIRIEGTKSVVDKVAASIEAFVADRDSQTTEHVEVAPEKHRLLIGRGGETRKNMESQFQVSIDVPRITEHGAARSQIKIIGAAEQVAKAKDHILELVKDQEGETVQVPRRSHFAIADNGRFFRRLNTDYSVKVDHAGQPLPAKPTTTTKARSNGAALPLITDDQDSMDNHVWDVVDQDEGSVEDGDIPWVLRGSPENVERARAALQRAMEQAQSDTPRSTCTGYLILPDPKTYRYVIGAGGNQINLIRKQTGCKITVPKAQAKGEPIEIVGSRDGVDRAKDIILDVVQNAGTRDRAE